MNIFKKISDEFYDDAVSMIIDLVNIDSVYDESTVSEEKPYGEGVYKTLVAFKDLAIFNISSADERSDKHFLSFS